MRGIKDNLPEILTIIILFLWSFVNSQVTIDRGLAIKLDYMAWRARQLDTVSVQLIHKNKGLNQLIDTLDVLHVKTIKEVNDLVQVNASLQIKNDLLENRYDNIYGILKDCTKDKTIMEKKIQQQEKKISQVISSRNSYIFANIGLSAIVVACVIAIVTAE